MCHLVAILMHLDFLDKNKRCAYDIGLNKESLFLQKKNENIITNRFTRKTKQQERISSKNKKEPENTKKMHASQFLFIVFLLFLLFFYFGFVLFALVLLLKNHIPRAVGLITLRQNGIWTPLFASRPLHLFLRRCIGLCCPPEVPAGTILTVDLSLFGCHPLYKNNLPELTFIQS